MKTIKPLIAMIALENVSSRIGDEILFTNLNTSFETGRIHGIWIESDVGRRFLHLLTGGIPLSSGVIRYHGRSLDPSDVAYYTRSGIPGPYGQDEWSSLLCNNEPVPQPGNIRPVCLFDNIFDPGDMQSVVRLYHMILRLREMGSTVLITSTDHKALSASTEFFHILSKGAFQAKLHFQQYDLLDDVFRHLRQS